MEERKKKTAKELVNKRERYEVSGLKGSDRGRKEEIRFMEERRTGGREKGERREWLRRAWL